MSDTARSGAPAPDRKVDRLDGVLTELITASTGISAAAVVSFDGLMMASALPEGLDDDRVAAMTAALLSLGEQAIDGFGCGQLDQLFAEGDEGFVVMLSARDEAVLTAVADRDAKVGFILYEMRRAAERVADILVAEVTTPVGPPAVPVELPLPSRPVFGRIEEPTPVPHHPSFAGHAVVPAGASAGPATAPLGWG